MTGTATLETTGELLVIETEDNVYLGTLDDLPGGRVKIRTHRVGNPVILDRSEIEELTLASEHPAVEVEA